MSEKTAVSSEELKIAVTKRVVLADLWMLSGEGQGSVSFIGGCLGADCGLGRCGFVVFAMVAFPEFSRCHADSVFEYSGEIALVVISDIETYFCACFVGSQQQAFCMSDSYTGEIVNNSDSHLFFKQMRQSRDGQVCGFCDVGQCNGLVVAGFHVFKSGLNLGYFPCIL